MANPILHFSVEISTSCPFRSILRGANQKPSRARVVVKSSPLAASSPRTLSRQLHSHAVTSVAISRSDQSHLTLLYTMIMDSGSPYKVYFAANVS
jgi:hypothetical protein